MAEQGDPAGHLGLAMMYRRGIGVSKDPAEAVRACRKAADAGLPLAQTYLGEMYDSGEGVSLDAAEAVRWYERAAAQNYPAAQVNLGLSLTWGTGTPTNFPRAFTTPDAPLKSTARKRSIGLCKPRKLDSRRGLAPHPPITSTIAIMKWSPGLRSADSNSAIH
jgi:TPR repeat protein